MTEPFVTQAFNPRPDQPCFCGSGSLFAQCCGSKEPDRPPPKGVHVLRGFLDPATCDEWVKVLDQQPGELTGVNRDGQVVVTKDRITERVFLEPIEATVINLMRGIFTTTIPQAMSCDLEWFERPQILRYRAGGYYRLHADSERYIKERKVWRKTSDRDVSILLYLNDDFEGGDLSFFAMNYTFTPRKGDLLFFPSDHRYAHRAHEVTRGRRYVIVSWAAQRGVPKVKTEPTWNSIAL